MNSCIDVSAVGSGDVESGCCFPCCGIHVVEVHCVVKGTAVAAVVGFGGGIVEVEHVAHAVVELGS